MVEAVAGQPAFLRNGGDMGARMRSHDWASTPLGPPNDWPLPLRVTVATVLDSSLLSCILWGPDLLMLYNDAYAPALLERHPYALGRPLAVVWDDIWDELRGPFMGVFETSKGVAQNRFELTMLRHGKREQTFWNYSVSPLYDGDSRVVGLLNQAVEITAQVRAEQKQVEAETRLRLRNTSLALEVSNRTDERDLARDGEITALANGERVQLALAAGAIIGTWNWDLRTNQFDLDEAFANSFGIDPKSNLRSLSLAQVVENVHPDDQAGLAVAIEEGITRGGRYAHQYRVRRRDGRYYWLEANGHIELSPDGTPLRFPGVLLDIEERRALAEERDRALNTLRDLNDTLEQRVRERTEELERSKEALRQSQKMEAVGQLTGGLAHDFNNLLAIVNGSLELIERRMLQGRFTDAERFMGAARDATKRATALTHRLLAFSRRQTLDPQPTDVNHLVQGMDELIRRTVGPSIGVETIGQGGLWNAIIDASQLENALLNLCINARDAMPDGGKLTIETANKWLDEHAAKEREVPVGQYISLCVSDSGTGMTPEVIAKAFDPFFTTKPLGQGTGLGLSMIYGFARQSGGQVRIYSEQGEGSMVCIYLPRHLGKATNIDALAPAIPEQAEDGDTVLVVDDEIGVRMLVVETLKDLGYTAIEAGDGPAAMRIIATDIRIDLLVTDVGLPNGMNGRQVADAARVKRPNLKVLFITGYAENAVVGNGHLDHGMAIVTKPFSVDDVANKVKAMIAQ